MILKLNYLALFSVCLIVWLRFDPFWKDKIREPNFSKMNSGFADWMEVPFRNRDPFSNAFPRPNLWLLIEPSLFREITLRNSQRKLMQSNTSTAKAYKRRTFLAKEKLIMFKETKIIKLKN